MNSGIADGYSILQSLKMARLSEGFVASGTGDISVIIPYHNRERYIDEAVESVLAQTLKPLEIIIVNDCSRESSRRYIDRYADICTIVDLPVNGGLAGARNAGIQAARGRVIAFLDDDDAWLPNKLALQCKYLEEHSNFVAVHTAVWEMRPDGTNEFYRRFGPGPLNLTHAMTNDSWVIPSTIMISTEVARSLGGFDPAFRSCEDREFIIRFCAAGHLIGGISEPLVRLRRQGHGSLTSKRWHIFRTDLRMCWKHREIFVRAYGSWGIARFILEKLQEPTAGTPFLAVPVHYLLRYVRSRCRIKSGYREPVASRPAVGLRLGATIEKATLIGGHSL
jgi:teichuronic acid biosynthesis glycosyltransferase TuaG